MTMTDLYSLYHIEKEVQAYKGQLFELQKVEEMSNGDPETKLLIAKLQELLEKAIQEKLRKSIDINEYILTCDDAQIRRILFLRFVSRKSWNYIALQIGGGNTADSVRKRCTRYVNKN